MGQAKGADLELSMGLGLPLGRKYSKLKKKEKVTGTMIHG